MSELGAELDGRNLWEDIGNYCSFARTPDLPLIDRPFPLIVNML